MWKLNNTEVHRGSIFQRSSLLQKRGALGLWEARPLFHKSCFGTWSVKGRASLGGARCLGIEARNVELIGLLGNTGTLGALEKAH